MWRSEKLTGLCLVSDEFLNELFGWPFSLLDHSQKKPGGLLGRFLRPAGNRGITEFDAIHRQLWMWETPDLIDPHFCLIPIMAAATFSIMQTTFSKFFGSWVLMSTRQHDYGWVLQYPPLKINGYTPKEIHIWKTLKGDAFCKPWFGYPKTLPPSFSFWFWVGLPGLKVDGKFLKWTPKNGGFRFPFQGVDFQVPC